MAQQTSLSRKGNSPYSAVLTREQFLFYEVRTTAKLVNEGLSESKHGGATWYQMRLTFDEDYYLARMFQVSDNPDDNIQAIENAVWNLLC